MKLELISRIPAEVRHKTPLLFVHGAWHGAWCWEPNFMPYFADKGYAVYALSLRGHGKSDGRAGLKWYRVKDYVEDLRKVVAKLPCNPVLVGHSLGGFVVQKYLERHESPGAVLMGSVPFGGIVKMLERVVRKHPLRFLKINFFLSLYPFVDTPSIAREMLFSSNISKEDLRRYHSLLQDESYLAFLDMLLLSPRPERIRTPMFVVGAENDNVFYRRDMRKTARAFNQQAVIIPDIAHDMMLERDWRRAAIVILGWLKDRGI
jgi:pimeloyl-ACP methyl ester carboxylesterase